MILIWSVWFTYIYASPGENQKVSVLGIWNDPTPKNIRTALHNVDQFGFSLYIYSVSFKLY